ncbi:unnamed protein product, partial [marine sediment metagenome]
MRKAIRLDEVIIALDKQLVENNIEEVLKPLEYVEKQSGLDGKMIKKITETYKAIGRDDLVKKFAAQITKDSVVQKEMKVSKTASSTQKLKKEPVAEKDTGFKKDTIKFDKDEKRLNDNIEHFDIAVKDIESAISQLRKAIRLDEVIIALDKQLVENNIEEVLKPLEYVEKQSGLDGKMIKKITETYKAIGRDDLVKKFAAQITKDSVVQKEMKVSKTASSTQKLKKEPVAEKNILMRRSFHLIQQATLQWLNKFLYCPDHISISSYKGQEHFCKSIIPESRDAL